MAPHPIVPGDQVWLLMSSALVQLMTPGVAFFYGGLVGESNVISTMMLSFRCALALRFWLRATRQRLFRCESRGPCGSLAARSG